MYAAAIWQAGIRITSYNVCYTKLLREWVEGPYVSVERLHRLRIAAKGLRYTLEFFESVLGKEVEPLIKDFKVLQDHLGDLHDAAVATSMLGFYLKTGTWDPSESYNFV